MARRGNRSSGPTPVEAIVHGDKRTKIPTADAREFTPADSGSSVLRSADRRSTRNWCGRARMPRTGPTPKRRRRRSRSAPAHLENGATTGRPPFVTRVRIQNFKSIKACDLQLGSLAILVGPNGSGKSNFLDALRFTTDSLATTLDHALRERGGINEVRRRSGGHPNHFAIAIDLQLPSAERGARRSRSSPNPMAAST